MRGPGGAGTGTLGLNGGGPPQAGCVSAHSLIACGGGEAPGRAVSFARRLIRTMTGIIVFEGQAVHAELVVVILEKHDLHPTLREKNATPDLDDLERDTFVTVPDDEAELARDILNCESPLNQLEF